MTKNPFINALAAAGYIVLISLFMFGVVDGPADNSIIMPIAMISLFTLSAAVMGCIFLLKPVTLYMDGKKKEAIALFAQTIGAFAAITLILLSFLFFI